MATTQTKTSTPLPRPSNERERKARLIRALTEKRARKAQRLFKAIFPDTDTPWDGPSILGGLISEGQILHARSGYQQHLEFFRAGKEYRERCFMCANRIGKTLSGGGFELACHLTGDYPSWWEGREFDGPISAWAAGDTYETTRDIIQLNLLGEVDFRGGRKVMDGRGVVPGEHLGIPTWRQGVQGIVDTIPVRHIKGGWSVLGLKSYDQGRKAFQGTGKHVVWFDEEPPVDVYGEALIRTATLDGITMLTFTPLMGMSEVVMSFLPQELRPDIIK